MGNKLESVVIIKINIRKICDKGIILQSIA